MLDLDHFKEVNDRYGHYAGDEVLKAVTSAISDKLRSEDILGRWGGEEFVVLLRDCVLSDALRLAEDIRAAIAEVPFGTMGSITASFGVAEVRDGEDLTTWLRRADQALYRAKRSGRNEVVADTD
jgi:diguanylate cyclase (GGDEF)-like protein